MIWVPRVPPDADEPLRDVVESFESDAADLGRDPASLWRETERRDAERESCLNERQKKVVIRGLQYQRRSIKITLFCFNLEPLLNSIVTNGFYT